MVLRSESKAEADGSAAAGGGAAGAEEARVGIGVAARHGADCEERRGDEGGPHGRQRGRSRDCTESWLMAQVSAALSERKETPSPLAMAQRTTQRTGAGSTSIAA